MFAGSDDGGRRAAVLYSLIESAKRAAVEPWAYLRELLVRIDTHPASTIAELMPCHWKPTV
jgi:transposase